MGIKDRFKQISTNASTRTEEESTSRTRESRQPRTAPGMAAAASRLFLEEKEKLLQEINALRQQLENANSQSSNESAQAEIEALRRELEEKESVYGIKKILVVDCHIKPATENAPSRKRKLSSKEFDALKQSIKTVGMSIPILVEPREEGGFWIVAGHNRHQVHVDENIELIRAEVVNPEELDVDAAALVSNLLTPELSTYEFYQGIRYFRDQLGKTVTEIANMTGRGKSTISEYFSLEKLPDSVLDVLKETNLQIGSTAVVKLSKVTTPDNISSIKEALLAVSNGANWNDQIRMIEKTGSQEKSPEKKSARPQIIKIEKSGKAVATMSVRQNNLSIKFSSQTLPEGLMEKIKQLIDESTT